MIREDFRGVQQRIHPVDLLLCPHNPLPGLLIQRACLIFYRLHLIAKFSGLIKSFRCMNQGFEVLDFLLFSLGSSPFNGFLFFPLNLSQTALLLLLFFCFSHQFQLGHYSGQQSFYGCGAVTPFFLIGIFPHLKNKVARWHELRSGNFFLSELLIYVQEKRFQKITRLKSKLPYGKP